MVFSSFVVDMLRVHVENELHSALILECPVIHIGSFGECIAKSLKVSKPELS